MNVLSIDIDAFFKECFQYQRYIDDELTPLQSWKVIEWKTGTQDYEVDKECFNFVKEVLKNKCKTAEHFLIQEHDEIINIIKNYGKNNFVTNIDYHCDITYGNDDAELNIENWVKHGRVNNYIGKYLWICQDGSEDNTLATFNYSKSSWKDVVVDNLPEYDLVVFCISHQFTPPKHWRLAQDLREYLANDIQNDFVLCKEPKFDEDKYPYFFTRDESATIEKSAWYKYYDYYINAELCNNVVWLSIINLGDKKRDILTPCSRLVSGVLKYYDVGFTWDKEYTTSNFINRLANEHKIKDKYDTEFSHNIIVERGS